MEHRTSSATTRIDKRTSPFLILPIVLAIASCGDYSDSNTQVQTEPSEYQQEDQQTEEIIVDNTELPQTFASVPVEYENVFEELEAMRAENPESVDYKVGSFTATFGGIGSEYDVAPDGSMPLTATHVVRNLQSVWDLLTPAQQAAATQKIVPDSLSVIGTLDAASNSDFASTDKSHGHEFQVRTSSTEILESIRNISQEIQSLFRWELVQPIAIISRGQTGFDAACFVDNCNDLGETGYVLFPQAGQFEEEVRSILNLPENQAADCAIIVGPEWLNSSEQNQVEFLTFTIFNCYQNNFSLGENGQSQFTQMPSWLIEGSAAWVTEQLTSNSRFKDVWPSYFANPRFSLFGSSYDAIGFWQHAALQADSLGGIDKWRLIAMAHASSTRSVDILNDITSNLGERHLRVWSASSAGRGDWGDVWNMTLPNTAAGLQRQPETQGFEVELEASSGETYLAELQMQTVHFEPVIYATETEGNGYLHWQGESSSEALGVGDAWCVTDEPCVCSDGNPPSEYPALEKIPSSTLHVALNTAGNGRSSTFNGRYKYLDEVCEDINEPVADSGPTGGFSFGDPHMLTFDGLYYSFQLTGEFILAKSTRNSLEIQTRFTPWFRSNTVSMTSAIAMNMDGHKVQFTGAFGSSSSEILIDGTELILSDEQHKLDNGGLIYYDADFLKYVFEWADGSITEVRQFLGTLEIRVIPANVHRGILTGLYGNYDGEEEFDLALRTGELVENSLDQVLINSIFADSWRIDMDESLFTYASGQDTSTFTDKAFPSEFFKLSELLELDAFQDAIAICESNGIVSQVMRLACALDLFYTESNEFVQSAAYIEQRLREQRAIGVELPDSVSDVPSWYQCDENAWAVAGLSPREILMTAGESIEDADEAIQVVQTNDDLFGTGQVYCSARLEDSLRSRAYSVRTEIQPTSNPFYEALSAFGENTLEYYVTDNSPDAYLDTLAGFDVAVSEIDELTGAIGEVFVKLPAFDLYIQVRVPDSQENTADLKALAATIAQSVLSRIP